MRSRTLSIALVIAFAGCSSGADFANLGKAKDERKDAQPPSTPPESTDDVDLVEGVAVYLTSCAEIEATELGCSLLNSTRERASFSPDDLVVTVEESATRQPAAGLTVEKQAEGAPHHFLVRFAAKRALRIRPVVAGIRAQPFETSVLEDAGVTTVTPTGPSPTPAPVGPAPAPAPAAAPGPAAPAPAAPMPFVSARFGVRDDGLDPGGVGKGTVADADEFQATNSERSDLEVTTGISKQLRPWIGRSDCNECPTTVTSQNFIFRKLEAGRTYRIRYYLAYHQGSVPFRARESITGDGGMITKGATFDVAGRPSDLLGVVWEIEFKTNGSVYGIKLDNAASAGKEYLYVDAVEIDRL